MPTAVEMTIKIEGLEGVGIEQKGFLNVLSFSWGASVPERKAGHGPQNNAFEDLVIVKHTDQATPQLMLACANGRHYKEATFMVIARDETGAQRGNAVLLKIEDVVVESVRMMGNEMGVDFPTEEVTLDGARVSAFTVAAATGGGVR